MEADRAVVSGSKAAPLTAVIARRVRELRQAADMRGSALAAKLVALGVPWTRTTVAKFETGHRATISVQELLALALALSVPPAALLVDPAAEGIPLADGAEPETWTALLWLLGRGEIDGSTPAGDVLMRATHQAYEAIHDLESFENVIWPSGETPSEEQLEALASSRDPWLRRLSAALQILRESGLHVPLPDFVVRRARERGIAGIEPDSEG